jgi:carboxylesterase type B
LVWIEASTRNFQAVSGSWRQVVFLGALLAPSFFCVASSQALLQGITSACTEPVVKTVSGKVCGVRRGEVDAFLGIPYAETTAGKNRWMPPVKKASWSGTLPATRFGFACPQNGTQPLPQSEDCLTLNIWTPSSATNPVRLPVLVFLHGGAFQTGSSGDTLPSDPKQALYDGAFLASSQNIVVVTLHYRVGALGFLAGAMGLKGNYGFQDQQLALEWVRDNIAAFGGDAKRLTLAGESAGAMSVGLHLWSAPRSDQLFSAAIMQSNPLAFPFRTLTQAQRTADYFTMTAGCYHTLEPLRCLRRLPMQAILDAQRNPMLMLPMLEFGLSSVISWTPVVDGEVIMRSPTVALERGVSSKPLLIGVNANEGELFVGVGAPDPLGDLVYRVALGKFFGAGFLNDLLKLYPSSASDSRNALAKLTTEYMFLCANLFAATKAKAPTYAYQFNYVSKNLSQWPKLSLCQGKACHSDSLPFTFGNLGSSNGVTRDDVAMRDRLTNTWGTFVRAHQPSFSEITDWPRITSNQNRDANAILELSPSPRVNSPQSRSCAFWDRYGYGSDMTTQ